MIHISWLIFAAGLALIIKGILHKERGLFDFDGALLIVGGLLVWLVLGVFYLGIYIGGAK